MNILHKFLNVFVSVSLLISTACIEDPARPQHSLWGKVADFSSECSLWRLNPDVSIPTLQELTVCLHLQLKKPSSLWTAFMYRHPDVQCAELGLGGKSGRLVVWLFGMKWISSLIQLPLDRWHSVCLTWSHQTYKPVLYVNGNMADITPADDDEDDDDDDRPLLISPTCCKLAPNGTLTLGAAHRLENGKIQIIADTRVRGKLSLFRLWGRERSKEEVTSLYCTEGDLVKWEGDNWDTQTCAPLPDSSLKCEWSVFEVMLIFAIIRFDGNNTEVYTARDIAHYWLRDVLPCNMYLHRVSVFEATRSQESLGKILHEEKLVRWGSHNTDRFDCLAYVNVIPSLDVAAVQNELYKDLKIPYKDPNNVLQLLADAENVHTTPVENFPFETVSPSVVVTETETSSITISTTATPPPSASSHTPGNLSYLYFEVKANVSITGVCDPEQFLSIWLNVSLPNDEMIVLNFQLLPKARSDHLNLQSNLSISPDVSINRVSRESCIFQVQVKMLSTDTQEMEARIQHLLEVPYNNGSIYVATEDVQISRIFIFECKAHSQQTGKGLFEWPLTTGGRNATQPCPKNSLLNATRHCKLGLRTQWMTSDMDDCPLLVETIPDLDHVKVTAENALDVAEMTESLLSNHSKLNYQDLVTILNKLKAIINISKVTPDLGQALINIISDILESDSDLKPFTNTILNITESVGDRMMGFEGSSTLVALAIAISVVDVDPEHFGSLSFGVSSVWTGSKPEIFINRYPYNGTVAFISLPSILQYSFPQSSLNHSISRVQFQFYGIPMLFKNSHKGQILNTFVVSASVTNASSPIKDLDEDIQVTLHHLTHNTLYKDVECVYWNFNKNNGHGGWDGYGCRKYNSSSNYTTCLCDHLTHFGVLLDVSRTWTDPANEQILTIITYVGCGVSSLFLGITVLTYTAFEKLRRDYPSQILINLSLALLGLNLMFLVNSWLSSWGRYGLCVVVASTLHYFLLASFTWMGLEAVNMYFALVKVFNVYVPSYILKFCALGWGIPLVICVLVLIIDREAYGSHLYTDAQPSLQPLDNSENFCWLQDDVVFYVSVVAYAVLVFLFNTAIFVVVLIQIRHMRVNRPAGIRSGLMHDLKGVASLTLLLGLTWTIGFFTWGPARIVMLYLFSGLNTLQGLFIFLFHCLMKENVRKQWRIHLCLGRFRLEEYSEGSNSASVGVVAKSKANPPRTLVPSVRSVKSSSTESTSASSDSIQRDSSCKRPNLGLFSNGLALPRAHRSPSVAGTPFSHRGMNPTPGWSNHLLDQQGHK